MSRRKERKWEEVVNRHAVGGGEEWHTDWAGVAQDVGLEAFDADGREVQPSSFPVEDLQVSAKSKFLEPDVGRILLVMVTLKCQRCDRRHDTWRVRCTGWTRTADDGWQAENLTITSEMWAKEIGDSTFRLFQHFEDRSMTFQCVCGVQNIQFSVRRLREIIEQLLPDSPHLSPDGDRILAMPSTRHATIRG